MKTPKAIFFDLDGTLLETSYEISDAINDTMEHFGLDKIDEEECKEWIGHGTLHLMRLATAKVKKISYKQAQDDTQMAALYDYFRIRYFERTGTRSWLFEGALKLLQTLKKNNIKIGIITNKETAFVEKILTAHKLDTLTDCIVCGDTLEVKKPDPAGVFYMMDKLDLKITEDILFIGDSKTDILTARNAKLRCWAVTYGYNAGEKIQDSSPDKIINSLEDIIKLIRL